MYGCLEESMTSGFIMRLHPMCYVLAESLANKAPLAFPTNLVLSGHDDSPTAFTSRCAEQ